MLKEFVERWDKYKDNLENYFRNTKQEEYNTYEKIVELLFEKIINQEETEYHLFSTDNMTVIDDGDYQGTQIFVIPLDTYQPNVTDYIVTNTYYGSCSGCDTLKSINNYDYDELPNEEQIEDYMQLALHLLQKCKWLYNKEEFEEYY